MDPTSENLYLRARVLVERIANGCKHHNLGSATVSIYDTAWVSMIIRPTVGGDDEVRWLFLESFSFILDSQLPDGGWESYFSIDDGILNTMAAMLAIIRRINALRGLDARQGLLPNLRSRISKAKTYLEKAFQKWDVESSMHVRFEILVPALLTMLENESIYLNFPGRKLLMELNAVKLSGINPEMLYETPTTFLHSLEAFIGTLDFDRVGHHKRFGRMMASPASTAAYLIHSSTWDEEAEGYVRRVIFEGKGKGVGGVPSVFPTTIFEMTWVLSTLIHAGFPIKSLGEENVDKIACCLQEHLQMQQGLLGFCPSVLADAGDTAKAILTLYLLGRTTSLDAMIEHFRSKQGHFQTYLGERDVSFSANCNILKAILGDPGLPKYESDVSRIMSYLCDSWWKGAVKDKWNASHQYSMILLAEAFVDLLQLWDKGTLKLQPEHLLRDFIPVILIQILNRTLLTQSSEGGRSTHESPEISAYAILTLVAVSTLPWFDLLGTEIQSALEAERQFLSLSQHEWTKPSYIWIEKVTYGSSNLSEAYCLAAMNARKPPVAWSDRVNNLVHISAGSICKICEFLSSLEVYHGEPIWKLKASALEGLAFLPRLKTAGDNILKGQEGTKKEYFNYIPITWATVNNVKEVFMDADLLLEMMVLTVCNFRVDEYMENVVVNFMHDESDLAKAKAVVRMLCTQGEAGNFETRKDPHEALAGPIHGSDNNSDKITELEQCSDLVSFKAMIGYYVKAVLYHLRVRQASPSDQCQLRIELQAFLLSHIDHIQDNARYSKCNFLPAKTAAIFLNPCTSYYSWAHSTGAVSVSCPFSFAFFTSLLGSSPLRRGDCFPLLGRNYLAADLCFHLAVMSRMYNDYGSITRDRLEANINSINFPEFHTSPVHDPEAKKQDLKTNLLALAQYERECVDTIAERLVTDLRTSFGDGAAKARGLTLFVGVTALYADMYVAKDFSDPKRKTQSEEGVSRHL